MAWALELVSWRRALGARWPAGIGNPRVIDRAVKDSQAQVKVQKSVLYLTQKMSLGK